MYEKSVTLSVALNINTSVSCKSCRGKGLSYYMKLPFYISNMVQQLFLIPYETISNIMMIDKDVCKSVCCRHQDGGPGPGPGLMSHRAGRKEGAG